MCVTFIREKGDKSTDRVKVYESSVNNPKLSVRSPDFLTIGHVSESVPSLNYT